MSEETINEDALLKEVGVALGDDLATAGVRTRSKVPAGEAVVKIENVFFNKATKTRRPQMCASMTVVEHEAGEEFIGMTYIKYWGLESAENFKWLNGDLVNLDLEIVTKIEQLKERQEQLTGIVLTIAFVENGQYPPNAYINEDARRQDLEGEISDSSDAPF